MNELTLSDRLLRVSPLVLRLGLAAILIHGGIEQIAPMLSGESGETLSASPDGVVVSANWTRVVGAGACVVGGLLLVGFLTRLTSMGVLGAIGYGAYESYASAGGEVINQAAEMFNASQVPLMLLAVGCASLLVSGAGCVGFDSRAARLRRLRAETAAV